jgi:hypothetical protein
MPGNEWLRLEDFTLVVKNLPVPSGLPEVLW